MCCLWLSISLVDSQCHCCLNGAEICLSTASGSHSHYLCPRREQQQRYSDEQHYFGGQCSFSEGFAELALNSGQLAW